MGEEIAISLVEIEGDGVIWRGNTVYRILAQGRSFDLGSDFYANVYNAIDGVFAGARVLEDDGAAIYLAAYGTAGLDDPRLRLLRASVPEDCIVSACKGEDIVNSIPNFIRANLSIASVYCDESENIAATGKIMVVERAWKKHVVALEVSIDSDRRLNMAVRTFTNVSDFKDGVVRWRNGKPHKRIADYTRFYVNDFGILIPITKSDSGSGQVYIQARQTFDTERSSIDTLALWYGKGSSKENSPESHKWISKKRIRHKGHTKLGILAGIIEDMRDLYGDGVSLKFKRLEASSRISSHVDQLRTLDIDIPGVNLLFDKRIPGCVRLYPFALECLSEWGVKVEDGYPILKIVGDVDCYSDELPDAYDRSLSPLSVQHLTCDSKPMALKVDDDQNVEVVSKKQFDSAMVSCLRELAFKRDVLSCQISVANWSEFGIRDFCIAKPIKVCLRPEEGQIGTPAKCGRNLLTTGYSILEISESGELRYELIYADELFGFDREGLLCLLDDSDMEAAVRIDGCEFVIRNPNLFPIPQDLMALHKVIMGDVENSFRGKTYKGLYDAMLDINLFSGPIPGIEGDYFYYVGPSSKGISQVLSRFTPLRSICVSSGAFNADKYLPLLAVDGVRLGQPSVLPFPLKHLRHFEDAAVYELARSE